MKYVVNLIIQLYSNYEYVNVPAKVVVFAESEEEALKIVDKAEVYIVDATIMKDEESLNSPNLYK